MVSTSDTDIPKESGQQFMATPNPHRARSRLYIWNCRLHRFHRWL